jgi:hypothetical protein
MASGVICLQEMPISPHIVVRKWVTSSGMSSGRSFKGGTLMMMTLSRW